MCYLCAMAHGRAYFSCKLLCVIGYMLHRRSEIADEGINYSQQWTRLKVFTFYIKLTKYFIWSFSYDHRCFFHCHMVVIPINVMTFNIVIIICITITAIVIFIVVSIIAVSLLLLASSLPFRTEVFSYKDTSYTMTNVISISILRLLSPPFISLLLSSSSVPLSPSPPPRNYSPFHNPHYHHHTTIKHRRHYHNHQHHDHRGCHYLACN